MKPHVLGQQRRYSRRCTNTPLAAPAGACLRVQSTLCSRTVAAISGQPSATYRAVRLPAGSMPEAAVGISVTGQLGLLANASEGGQTKAYSWALP
jgi:hypothetical protein